jgi:hypothetical protein
MVGVYVVALVTILLAIAWVTGGVGELADGRREASVATRRRTGRGVRRVKAESALPAGDRQGAQRTAHNRQLRTGGRTSHERL